MWCDCWCWCWCSLFRHLNIQKWPETSSFQHFLIANVLRVTTACTFITSQRPKVQVVRDRQFLALLTSECASRHHNVHFFDISTSTNGPRPSVFNTFDLTSNCASCHSGVHLFDVSTSNGPNVFFTFSFLDFEMCIAPQRGALFQHLNFQKCPDPLCFSHFDFDHSSMHFFGISTSKRCLTMRCF